MKRKVIKGDALGKHQFYRSRDGEIAGNAGKPYEVNEHYVLFIAHKASELIEPGDLIKVRDDKALLEVYEWSKEENICRFGNYIRTYTQVINEVIEIWTLDTNEQREHNECLVKRWSEDKL